MKYKMKRESHKMKLKFGFRAVKLKGESPIYRYNR